MKKILMMGLFGVLAMTARAQYAQILENIAQQVAEFQEYISLAEKGYKIMEDGLHAIRDIKDGEFNLHSTFFGSLKSINPQVSGLAEVGEIIALQVSLVEQVRRALQAAQANRWLTPDEVGYIGKFYQVVLDGCNKDVDALTDLVTADRLSMTDGERIRRIQTLDNEAREENGIARTFGDRVGLLEMQREREGATIGSLRGLYGF